jgi:GNAT superfamily N-acetyltransferase
MTTAAAVSGLRIRPWHRDRGVAYLAPTAGRRPRVETIRACLDSLDDHGYHAVVTPALDQAEQVPFLAAGLSLLEELHLLHHDLDDVPVAGSTPDVRLRRGRRRDVGPVTDIDHLAFTSTFWHLGPDGLRETLAATPSSRFRVAWSDSGPVGYAAVGRSGRWSYLQRVAVDPGAQGRGVGRALVIDALRWSASRRCRQLMVNTQLGNDVAIGLYESLGFRRAEAGLAVLQCGLEPVVAP